MNVPTPSSSSDAIGKLQQARRIALGDAAFYPQIVPGVLPLVVPSAPLDIRRWGSEFLAETFSSPNLGQEHKEQLAMKVLPTVKEFLDSPGQDVAVLKSMVQTATSLYPLVFRHIIYHPNDSDSWQNMVAIKSNLLKRMDSLPSGVKVCCIKFIQRIVQVQTPGAIADPRRHDQNETSLALVPNDHRVLSPSNLQAEAFGLLDRLLSVFQDTTSDDAIFVTATLNSIGVLVRTRASVANRILNAILNFNPFKVASSASVTPRMKVALRSMERTVRAFLLNLNKGNPSHPLAGRVQGYLDRLQHSRMEVLEGKGRKRGALGDSSDGPDSVKRPRLGADTPDTPPQNGSPSLPSGAVTLAQLFTLTENEAHKNFDARMLQLDQLLRLLIPLLTAADTTQLDNAVNVVRARYLQYAQPQVSASVSPGQLAGALPDDDDEEYQPMDEAETIMNRLDSGSVKDSQTAPPPEVPTGRFELPKPDPITLEEYEEYTKLSIARLFALVENAPEAPKREFVMGRGPITENTKHFWVTVLARMSANLFAGVDVPTGKDGLPLKYNMCDEIRENFHRWIMGDFRRRLDHGITWLWHEWSAPAFLELEQGVKRVNFHSRKHTLRLFDAIIPYLDAKDQKLLIRFLSEIHDMNAEMIERVKRIAQDPERVQMAANALLYLVLYSPPAKKWCLDALEDLYLNCDHAKAATAKILKKYRPEALQESKPDITKTEISASASTESGTA